MNVSKVRNENTSITSHKGPRICHTYSQRNKYKQRGRENADKKRKKRRTVKESERNAEIKHMDTIHIGTHISYYVKNFAQEKLTPTFTIKGDPQQKTDSN